jgi:hypothetical protein
VQASVSANKKFYYASQIVDAHEGINEITLTMTPGVEVKGHLKVEGPHAPPVESFTILIESGHGRGNHSASVHKDGSFTMNTVPPGKWLLEINPRPEGMFEKSVRLGDKDLPLNQIELVPGLDAPLNIVVSTNTATIEGTVDAGEIDAASLKQAGILLAPVGKWHAWSSFYRTAVADSAGKFKLNAVAPGKYKIFALEKIDTSQFVNPESAELLDPLGDELEVPEGATVKAHPKLVPEEKAKELLKP